MAFAYGTSFTLTSLHRKCECGRVFLCGQCRVPLGDTNDWSGDHEGDKVVLLKVVSHFVKSGKRITSSDPHDAGSQYQPLSCSNCNNLLGKFYSSTPVHLNYKLHLYNINTAVIQEYKIGENVQEMIPASEAPITLEICQYYEEEFIKQKLLLEMLLEKLAKLEEVVFPPSEQDSSECKMTL